LPSTPQHRAKAENNEFFISELDNPFWDWAITATFYAALHYVEAYFANKAPALHPATHQMRDNYINSDAKLRSIYIDYRQLEDESRDARYDASITLSQSDATQSKRYLEIIKAVIVPLLP
jgi:hypothetical protein